MTILHQHEDLEDRTLTFVSQPPYRGDSHYTPGQAWISVWSEGDSLSVGIDRDAARSLRNALTTLLESKD